MFLVGYIFEGFLENVHTFNSLCLVDMIILTDSLSEVFSLTKLNKKRI